MRNYVTELVPVCEMPVSFLMLTLLFGVKGGAICLMMNYGMIFATISSGDRRGGSEESENSPYSVFWVRTADSRAIYCRCHYLDS